jgi:murein DD-endopeptidase MepM/ murein hydrolase activator NlpD
MAKLPRPFSYWTTYPGHGGIDYPYPLRTPIKASAPGRVDFSGWYSDRGGYAKFVDYGGGIRCGYYHLVDLSGLGVGGRVEYGSTFAYVGTTGHSTGPHLHHEVWLNGRIIAPPSYWNYIDQNAYVGDGSGAGDGNRPFPPPVEDEERDDDMTRNSGFYWTADGKTTYGMCNLGSGFFEEWSGVDGGYNNGIAAAFDMPPFAKITKGHRDYLARDCANVRAGQK